MSLYPIDVESDDKFYLTLSQKMELEARLQQARDRVVAASYCSNGTETDHIREATRWLIGSAAILGYDLVRKA